MRNDYVTKVEMTRLELCDLKLACTSLMVTGASKWKKLHDKLERQLLDLDVYLDMIGGEGEEEGEEESGSWFLGTEGFIRS